LLVSSAHGQTNVGGPAKMSFDCHGQPIALPAALDSVFT
jgi:hypothetical protein